MLEHPDIPKDTYRLAWLLVERHGDDAVWIAASIAHGHHDERNEAANAAWKKVVTAIVDLIEDHPPSNAVVH